MTKPSVSTFASAASTGILVVCALVVTTIALRRELSPATVSRAGVRFEAQPDWREYAKVGNRIGAADAKVTIVEFSDFQCPACREFETRLRESRRQFGRDLSIVYRHFPLNIHPHAVPAAMASECAARQGQFEPMHDALFAERDSLGRRPWRSVAATARVPDLHLFDRCMADSANVSAIVTRDRDAAERLGARGTPTILVNGVRATGVLPQAVLDSLVRAAMRAP